MAAGTSRGCRAQGGWQVRNYCHWAATVTSWNVVAAGRTSSFLAVQMLRPCVVEKRQNFESGNTGTNVHFVLGSIYCLQQVGVDLSSQLLYCYHCMCRQSRGARAAAAAVAAWQYMVDGPPNEPVFDAAAEASAAVAQLLDADVVITTYDVLQQVRMSTKAPSGHVAGLMAV